MSARASRMGYLVIIALALCVIATLMVSVFACSIDIEKASAQIEDGMTYDEVVSILGREGELQWTKDEETLYTWPCRNGYLSVWFEDGGVTHSGITYTSG